MEILRDEDRDAYVPRALGVGAKGGGIRDLKSWGWGLRAAVFVISSLGCEGRGSWVYPCSGRRFSR
jgi:hypothetical protein